MEAESGVNIKKTHLLKWTPRATSFTELKNRFQSRPVASKKTLTYTEKLQKKSLKNRMKKNQKLKKILKPLVQPVKANPEESKEIVIKNEENFGFSKLDFFKSADKKRPNQKDPKKLLDKITKQKAALQQLEEKGDFEKVVEIKEKASWKNALAKAEGVKVKDDENLLKKTIQRKKNQKMASKKKWQKREENVEKLKREKQEKRTNNLQKRKDDKKKSKLKKAVKRGKVIPGF